MNMKNIARTLALAALALTPVLTQAQVGEEKATTVPPKSTVPMNPRAPANDPRIGLKGGLNNAAEAAFGLQRMGTLPKPAGFSPENNAVPPTPAPEPPAAPAEGGRPRPAPMVNYGSTNSDLAFSGNHMFVGNYNGINFYDIDSPNNVKLRASLLCPGGQGDVSVYGHLLFMSAEAMNGRTDCGVQGIPTPEGYVAPPPPPPPAPGTNGPRPQRPLPPPSPDRFRGVRIFDITDMSNPKQVAAVQSCRGSHTHTVVPDARDKENIYVYISGTGGVRQADELPGCVADAKDSRTSLFSIDIIKVPLAHPEQAKIIASPRIFADDKTGDVAGLEKGGKHAEGEQTQSVTDKCHDITVYPAIGLAAGACSGNGILLDISDVTKPVRIAAVADPNYAFWHSANFNNDGTKVLFTDEWGGGSQPRCRSTDPMQWGADAIFDLKDRKLTLKSYYKMPAPQTENENCVAHNGSLVPIPGRDILVQSWYQGGISIVDFTETDHPVEIAFFDRGPTDDTKRGMGGQWSTYWYNGYIYGSEIARGVDVLKLVPTQFLTQNEIDASNQVHFDELNVQNQPRIVWPQNFTVARAYLDQLARGKSVAAAKIEAVRAQMAKVESSSDKKELEKLKALGAGFEKDAAGVKSAADQKRLREVAAIIKARS